MGSTPEILQVIKVVQLFGLEIIEVACQFDKQVANK